MRTLKPEQKRKLAVELACIASVILGIVILVLNLLKIIPANEGLIAYVIAYGFLIGPAITMLGIASFFETRKIPVKNFKKTR